jgi:hypothetical protein
LALQWLNLTARFGSERRPLPVLQCLGEMGRADLLGVSEVGDGAGEAQGALVGASGQIDLPHCRFHKLWPAPSSAQ